MKTSDGILVGALALALVSLVSNVAPSPSDAAKATQDLDASAHSKSDTQQDKASGGQAVADRPTSKSTAAAPQSTSTLPPNQPDAKPALADALEALTDAKEDSPETGAALDRALDQLRTARGALVEQKPCCLHTTPVDCPPVADCAERDACLIVGLPPIEDSQATYTIQGTHAFVSIFNAAAARGVENASIRAMNATRVCPTCKATHSPTTPCVKAHTGRDAPTP